MDVVQAELDRIARSRVRDTLLHYTRDGPQVLELERIAAHAAVEPGVAARAMAELEEGGPFVVERAHEGEPRWWVA
jgi:hypothetical protein